MKLENEEYSLLYKKLEYKFKNSGNELVNKIKAKEDLSDDDIKLLLKKLEYTFRKSDNATIEKLAKIVSYNEYSPVSYSNLLAKKKKDEKERDKEKEHIESFDEFHNSGQH